MNPLSTCDLCDANRDAPAERFRVLPPIFRDFGARMRFHCLLYTSDAADEL